MASKGKESIIRVAVCGLTSSNFLGNQGQGAGKSNLCNRFMRPNQDDNDLNHTSILNISEFSGDIVNNTHFLYWGEKVVGLEDGQDVQFQIVEHTEFVEDSSLKPFQFNKPYYKRCNQLKLTSSGKVAYVNPDQLALPEHYPNVSKFPDRFTIHGFIVCADVSSRFDDPSNSQKDFFERTLHVVLEAKKKPVVVACTKFDKAIDSSVTAVHEIVSKTRRQIPILEVSALKGVNVDLCFLVLAHMVDTKLPKTKLQTYADAKTHLDDRIRKNEEMFQAILDQKLTDFSIPLESAVSMLQSAVEFQLLKELCGSDRVKRLIRAKLRYLKQEVVNERLTDYWENLPHILKAMLPTISLKTTKKSCTTDLRQSKKFDMYFVDLPGWRDDIAFLKDGNCDQLPFDLLEVDEGKEILQKHIDEVQTEAKENAACAKIESVLNRSDDLMPGTDIQQLWENLGVSEDTAIVSTDRLIKLYNDRMNMVERKCSEDLQELFLERSELFDQSSGTDQSEVVSRVHQELMDCDRYKRFSYRTGLRQGQVLKHIGSMQVADKGAYGKSHLNDTIHELQNSSLLDIGKLQAPSHLPSTSGLQWILDPKDQCFNLAILARTEENSLTLRSDFMNHLSGSGTCEVDDRRYQLVMNLFHGNDITSLTSQSFSPQGAVAVVTSMECLDWLEKLLHSLWIPELGEARTDPPYRGMPLVILALDNNADSDSKLDSPRTSLHKRAKQLASSVQCVCVAEKPTTQPMRLVVTTVIHTVLLSLMNCVSHVIEFLNSKLQVGDLGALNVAVCTLLGDPYDSTSILSPWLRHQLVCSKEGTPTLFMRKAIDKQHRTCTLTFHSALNVKDITSSVRLGVILIYSTKRPASLAVIKFVVPKLPNIPKLIVAVSCDQSHDNQLLEEGRIFARQWEAQFVTSDEDTLLIGYASEFFSKCWFSRFSSWNAQNISEDVKKILFGKKQARKLPERPTYISQEDIKMSKHVDLKPQRHSIGVLLDSDHDIHRVPLPPSPVLPSHSTLPRSPLRSAYNRSSPLASEEEATYSSPIDIKLGKIMKQGNTLDRKKGSPHHQGFLSPTFFSPIHNGHFPMEPAPQNDPESEYASVQDASKMRAGMINSLKRQPKRVKTPSMSPPPPPPRETDTFDKGDNDLNETYATVQTPPTRRWNKTPSMSPPPPPLSPRENIDSFDEGDNDPNETYATVQTPPTRRWNKAPSMSPPLPPPISPRGNMEEQFDESNKFYTTVQTPPMGRRTVVPGPKKSVSGYDHLTSVGEEKKKRYDHLPPQLPPKGEIPPNASPPQDNLYATVDKKPKRPFHSSVPSPKASPTLPPKGEISSNASPPQDNLYATVDKKPKRPFHSSVPSPKASPTQPRNDDVEDATHLYSVVNKPNRSGPRRQPIKADRSPPQSNVADMYSIVHKPRTKPKPPVRRVASPEEIMAPFMRRAATPDEPLYSVPEKKVRPPPTAPKPKRSPTPSGGTTIPTKLAATNSGSGTPKLVHLRSESFDAAIALKMKQPSLLPDKPPYRHHLGMSPILPTRSHPAPRPDVRAASLPKEFRERTHSLEVRSTRVMFDDEGDKDDHPALPERKYSMEDLQNLGLDDEPPPLPPRNYSWSDVEDDDDELFQSDDDLDEPNTKWSISDHQQLYASINRFSVRSTTLSSIEAIYNVVNKFQEQPATPEAIYVNHQQQDFTEEEAAAYDTLENVLKSMARPPNRSMVPSPTEDKPKEEPKTTTATPSGAAFPGLGATELTPRQIKLIKQQQKLFQKLQKKTEKEADRRRKAEEKRRRREEEKKEGKRKGRRGKGQKVERHRYFGSPLEAVVDDDGVPIFVKKCAQIVEEKGLTLEGIYRVSGKKEVCLELQDKFDLDNNLDIESLELCETAISSTLKAFFKLLPDPLIPDTVAAMMPVINSLDADSQRTRVHEILNTMPRPNLKTLQYMVKHLHKIQQKQEVNKMTASNLAIVFWPTLMRPPLIDLADPSKQMGWQLAMTRIIEHPDFVP